MNVNKQANAITLELDDGTGRIDAKFWTPPADDENPNEDVNETDAWQEGVYVRVFGHIRSLNQSEKNSFVAMHITPIQDFNEITFHLLETIHVHLLALKEAQSGGSDYQMTDANQSAPHNPYAAPADQENDLQPLYATVLEVVQRASANSNEGASISFICEQMNCYDVTEEQVRDAIQYLSSEGHLYPTFDEEHFKA